jgi:hypothetical protein
MTLGLSVENKDLETGVSQRQRQELGISGQAQHLIPRVGKRELV